MSIDGFYVYIYIYICIYTYIHMNYIRDENAFEQSNTFADSGRARQRSVI